MVEENNDIFLAGGDALVLLAEPMQKKYSTKLFWVIHLVRTYLITDFSTPLPLYAPVHIFDDLPHLPTTPTAPSIPPVAYVLNGWPIIVLL